MSFVNIPKYKVPELITRFLVFLRIVKPIDLTQFITDSIKMPKFRLGNQLYLWQYRNIKMVIYIDNSKQFILSFNDKIIGNYDTLPIAKEEATKYYVQFIIGMFDLTKVKKSWQKQENS